MTNRVAVISDVHANWHALEAVLEAIDAEQPDELWCLGDLVGYGPRPNPCCAAVAERAALCLAGNHDLGVLGTLDLEEFTPEAAAAAAGRGSADPGIARELESLSPTGGARASSSSTAAPATRSGTTCSGSRRSRRRSSSREAPLVLVGHSHVPLALASEDGALTGGLAPAGTRSTSHLARAGC